MNSRTKFLYHHFRRAGRDANTAFKLARQEYSKQQAQAFQPPPLPLGSIRQEQTTNNPQFI